MSERERRRQLKSEYRESTTEAGVYLIVNERTNKALLGSTRNLGSLRNRVEFAKATNSPSALDGRLAADIREFGIEVFSLRVLEAFEPEPTMSTAEVLRDLSALEELWRERLDTEGAVHIADWAGRAGRPRMRPFHKGDRRDHDCCDTPGCAWQGRRTAGGAHRDGGEREGA